MVKKKEAGKGAITAAVIIVVAIVSFVRMGDVYRNEEATAFMNLGTAFSELGMSDKAIASFKKQGELDPWAGGPMFNIGVVLTKSGREGEAVQYYEKAIQKDPALAEAYNNLGVVFVRWGQCADAEALFLKAIEIKPFYGNPYNNLAACYFEKNEIEKALKISAAADARGVPISAELKEEILKMAAGGGQ